MFNSMMKHRAFRIRLLTSLTLAFGLLSCKQSADAVSKDLIHKMEKARPDLGPWWESEEGQDTLHRMREKAAEIGNDKADETAFEALAGCSVEDIKRSQTEKCFNQYRLRSTKIHVAPAKQ